MDRLSILGRTRRRSARPACRFLPTGSSAVAAGGLATVGSLPIFLLSAQAVLVGAELGTDVADLGLAASCWPGVLLFALVRVGRDSPGTASSAVQGGDFAGAAAGPALFGSLVATTDYPTAWRAAVAMLLGGLLLVVTRAMFLADRRHRPPARDLD